MSWIKCGLVQREGKIKKKKIILQENKVDKIFHV